MKRLLVVVLLLAVAGCATTVPPPTAIPAQQPAVAPPPPPPPPAPAPVSRATSAPAPSAMADQAMTGDTAHMVVAVDLAAVERGKIEEFRADMQRLFMSRNVLFRDSIAGQALNVHISGNDKPVLEMLCTPGDGEVRQFALAPPASDQGDYIVTLSPAYRGQFDKSVFDQAVQHLTRQLDSFATAPPVVRPAAPDRIAADLLGYRDLGALRRLFGPARAEVRLVDDAAAPTDRDVVLPLMGGGSLAVSRTPLLSDLHIVWVRAGTDPATGTAEIKLTLDAQDVARFAAMTGANDGKRIAIVLGDKIVVAPTVHGAIGREIAISMPQAGSSEVLRVLGSEAGPAPLAIVDLELTNGGGQKLSTLTH